MRYEGAARTGKNRRLLETYGITVEQWEAIWDDQGGCCAITGLPFKKLSDAQLDHDHRTGAVRGLLSARANERLLPAARDDPAALRRAAEYLERAASFPYGRVPPYKLKSPRKSTRYRGAPDWMQPKGKERNL